MKKLVKYTALFALLVLLAYKSVYIKRLSEIKNTSNAKFDAAAFSKKLWDEKMPAKIDSAVELPALMEAVKLNKEAGLTSYSNALAVGNYRYALIKTQGVVTAVKEDEVEIRITVADSQFNAMIATEYIYGNAIRDASGLIQLKDFPSTTDLNNVSEELNKIVRTTVAPEIRKTLKAGDRVSLTAAIEINKEHLNWAGIELLPVRIQILK